MPQHAGDLSGGDATVDLGDEIEEVIWVGKIRRPRTLEGDPALGVEPDPGLGGSHGCGGGIDRTHSCRRELARQEERCLAITATDQQGPLRRRHMENGGGKRRQGWGAHAPMISTPSARAVF
jgi:hypothetical protein